MTENVCIYCESNTGNSGSKEHVLPDFLGCPLKLEKYLVCRTCNNTINRELHLPLREILLPALVALGIKTGKTKTIPSRKARLSVNGEIKYLTITGTDLSLVQPRIKKLENGDYKIEARSKAEFEEMFEEHS